MAWLAARPARRDARLLAEHVGVRAETARAMIALVDAGEAVTGESADHGQDGTGVSPGG